MKRIVLGIVIICISVQAFSQTAFTLSGSINGAPDAWVRFTYRNETGKFINDSCSLQNGMFKFAANTNGGTLATLTAYKGVFKSPKDTDPNTVDFFIEPGQNTATGSYGNLKELKFSPVKSQGEWAVIQSKLAEWNKGFASFSAEFNRTNNAYNTGTKNSAGDKIIDSIYQKLKPLKQQLEVYAGQYSAIIRQFVITHPGSYVSAYEMIGYLHSWPLDSVKYFYDKLGPAVQNGVYGKIIKSSIDQTINSSSINKMASNFTAIDAMGKPLSLADFKGKYVLLDFWASWCLPCRESSPHLMQVFKKYNKSGFEIIAVASDDGNEKAWRYAMRMDKIESWHNVLRGAKTNKDGSADISNSINDKYGISELPTKILIDKSGIIIGRYDEAGAPALDKKLAEIFK